MHRKSSFDFAVAAVVGDSSRFACTMFVVKTVVVVVAAAAAAFVVVSDD